MNMALLWQHFVQTAKHLLPFLSPRPILRRCNQRIGFDVELVILVPAHSALQLAPFVKNSPPAQDDPVFVQLRLNHKILPSAFQEQLAWSCSQIYSVNQISRLSYHFAQLVLWP